MRTAIYSTAGIIVGAVFTYLCGALIAWSWNPGEWWRLWRLLCVLFAVFWMLFGGCWGAVIADEAAAHARYIARTKDGAA